LLKPAGSVKLFGDRRWREGLQTVDKAMKLLSHFSPADPEAGLSELARRADFDKAATRRFLVALANHGFIEQNPSNRKYRLGSAFLRFARMREATMPLSAIVQPALSGLALAVGETAHASLITGFDLATISIAIPPSAMRVHVDPSEPLPLNATASGIACLAFNDAEFVDAYFASGKLQKHTPRTAVSQKALRLLIGEARERGYARAAQSFDDEVIGTAVPLSDWSGKPFGAIAVAAVASRFNQRAERLILAKLLEAAVKITRETGGEPHANVLRAMQEALA
jgi:IclR family transcriptional regulator, acetate operon repressor